METPEKAKCGKYEHVNCSYKRFFYYNQAKEPDCMADISMNSIWSHPIAYLILRHGKQFKSKLTLCNFCFTKLESGKLPSRCVLNNMLADSLPKEISDLHCLRKLFTIRWNLFRQILIWTPKWAVTINNSCCCSPISKRIITWLFIFRVETNKQNISKILLKSRELFRIESLGLFTRFFAQQAT